MAKFSKQVIVIKWGGAALADASAEQTQVMLKEIAVLHQNGLPLVIVHGGGPEISTLCKRLQIPIVFKNGLRITDAATLDVVKMTLLGKINPALVNALNQAGIKAVGLSGLDARFIQVQKLTSNAADFGFVGEITHIDSTLLNNLLAENVVPVIAPLGVDADGQMYNINADCAASAIASTLLANKLIMLTDVDGFYQDPENPSSLLNQIHQTEMQLWLQQKKIYGGMVPKMQASLDALDHGVSCVHIINGKTANNLLAAVSGHTIGTCIIREELKNAI